MAVANVSSPVAAPAQQGTVSSAAASSAMLSQGQFLRLLTAQLQNQDPLNPVSSSDFTSQLAQLSTVSGVQQLNGTLQQLLQLQQLSQGAALVGKTVLYGSSAQSASPGVVSSVTLQNGQLVLQVGGQSVPVNQVQGIVQSGSQS